MDSEEQFAELNKSTEISITPQLADAEAGKLSTSSGRILVPNRDSGCEAGDRGSGRGSLYVAEAMLRDNADSTAAILSTTSEPYEVKRSINAHKQLEHSVRQSNAPVPADGFANVVASPASPLGSACTATAAFHRDGDASTAACLRPQSGSMDVKSEANATPFCVEKTGSCEEIRESLAAAAGIAAESASVDFPSPGRNHAPAASLLPSQDHVSPDSSSSTLCALSAPFQLTSLSTGGTTYSCTAAASDEDYVTCETSLTTPNPTKIPPPLSLQTPALSSTPKLSSPSNSANKAADSFSRLPLPVTFKVAAPPLSADSQNRTASSAASLSSRSAANSDGRSGLLSGRHKVTDSGHHLSVPVIEEVLDFAGHYTAGVLQGLPPLFLAAAERNAATVRLLLKFGANPNLQDGEGSTPLHLSASVEFQSWECAVALIEHGAKVRLSNRYGTTPADLSPDLIKEHTRILTDTLINTILSTRQLSEEIQQGCRGSKVPNDAGTRKSHSSAPLSAKFRARRSSHFISVNTEALSRKASSTAKEKRTREGSVGRTEFLGIGLDRERTSSLSSTRSRFSFNFANKQPSTSPPPTSNAEDSTDMDSRPTDPERVSQSMQLLQSKGKQIPLFSLTWSPFGAMMNTAWSGYGWQLRVGLPV